MSPRGHEDDETPEEIHLRKLEILIDDCIEDMPDEFITNVSLISHSYKRGKDEVETIISVNIFGDIYTYKRSYFYEDQDQVIYMKLNINDNLILDNYRNWTENNDFINSYCKIKALIDEEFLYLDFKNFIFCIFDLY
jgi:hypothetical protein